MSDTEEKPRPNRRLQRRAREIKQTTGMKYTEALRLAKSERQVENR